MEAYLSWGHAAAHIIDWWSKWFGPAASGSGTITCVVECAGAPTDAALLALLERQLDRCGPENLTAPVPSPAPRCPDFPLSEVLFAVLLAFLLGFTTGRLFLGLSGAVRRTERPTARAAPLTVRALAASPHQAGASEDELRRLGLFD